jgi:hypothetical protein
VGLGIDLLGGSGFLDILSFLVCRYLMHLYGKTYRDARTNIKVPEKVLFHASAGISISFAI